MSAANALTSAYAARYPGEVARLLARVDVALAQDLLAALPGAAAAMVLAAMAHPDRLLAHLDDPELARLVGAGPEDVCARLLVRLDVARRDRILAQVTDAGRRRTLERLAAWPDGSVGALVNSNLLALGEQLSVSEALEQVQALPAGSRPLLVVVAAQGAYCGLLDLRALLSAAGTRAALGSCADSVAPLLAEAPLDAALEHPGWLDHSVLPVTDHRGQLLGAINRAALLARLEALGPVRAAPLEALSRLAGTGVSVMSQMLLILFSQRDTAPGPPPPHGRGSRP